MIPTAASAAKAHQVFGTPELLEHIMCYTSVRDLLETQQVDMRTALAISSSKRLQRKLTSSASDADSPWMSHFEQSAFPSFSVDLDYTALDERYTYILADLQDAYTNAEKEYVQVVAGFTSFGDSLPRLGQRIRGMLICQPSLKKLEVHMSCCGTLAHIVPDDGTPPLLPIPPADVKSETGITVGDLLRETRRLQLSLIHI